MAVKKKTTKKVEKTENKLFCTMCGKTRAIEKYFYTSNSNLFSSNKNRLFLCKDCVNERYEELIEKYMDELKALYHLCMSLDVYYNNDLATKMYAKINMDGKGNLAKLYFSKIMSLPQYKGKTSIDSDMIILDESILKDLVIEEDTLEFNVTPAILKRWGRGYTNEEYQELEERYHEWLDNHDHDTLATEKLFREIVELEILKNKARQNNDTKSFKDFSELLSKKMGDANIKPTQKKALVDGENETLGTLIEEIEKTEPILLPSEEFEDVDKIYHYIKTFFVKPFARVFGHADANDSGEVELHEEFANTLEEEIHHVEN